jgi:DNA-binding phage protein
MLKDFRESFKADLLDAEFQREFIAAAYEEEGAEGVIRALREVAAAYHNRPGAAEETSALEYETLERNPAFTTVRAALNALGLDLMIVRKEARRTAASDSAASKSGVASH